MWELVQPRGTVVALEQQPGVASFSRRALDMWRNGMLEDASFVFMEANVLEGTFC
jgi:hypothetical protein